MPDLHYAANKNTAGRKGNNVSEKLSNTEFLYKDNDIIMDTFLSDLRFYENEGSKYKNNEKEG